MWSSWRAAPIALPLPARAVAGSASGINDAGVVVGDVFRADGYQYGVRWLHGRILGRLPALRGGDGETSAFVVNDQERVAEESTFNADQVPEAAVVDPSTRPRGLGVFAGFDASAPFGISPGGRIVGQDFRFDHTAFRVLYWPGHGPTKTLLPIGGNYAHESSNAHAVDDYGNVAGWSSPRPSSDPLTIVTTDLVPTLWTCADRQAFVPPALARSR